MSITPEIHTYIVANIHFEDINKLFVNFDFVFQNLNKDFLKVKCHFVSAKCHLTINEMAFHRNKTVAKSNSSI
ncbi:hypothetical protein SDC9_31853 [bioreactor metagenome]|uniref:Uncharacterized protein n=1 Tax=bioreactor metagenome TaxID=1076179 RepID=A0A644V3G5_9ZZZZ